MKRRAFLQSSIALAGGGTVVSSLAAPSGEAASCPRQFYELRLYHLRRGPQQELFDSFWREAAIPALNRAGLTQVGVFGLTVGPESPTMYVLLAHPSFDSLIATPARLDADEEFQKTGAEFLNAPPGSPAYVRMESSLMIAFEGMPKLEAPSYPGGGRSRIFELRTYESHSRKAHLKKVEMFNRWEMSIFRRTGLPPVFFGQTLIGGRQPNLTYMLGFENSEARDKGWGAFGADPEWKKVRSTRGYTDPEIVCDISNVLLRPASYSRI